MKPVSGNNLDYTPRRSRFIGGISLVHNLLPSTSKSDANFENFFGCIRSHGVRNTNPNILSFVNSFKSLIINNYLSTLTSGNCENDK